MSTICDTQPPPDPHRRDIAYDKRVQAAAMARDRMHPCHHNNCDEYEFPYVGNYSKGLQHDGVGDVIPSSATARCQLHRSSPLLR
ncbi:MAG TPA: hypothetical protein VFJ82_22235 [Longimicrobium sp.]|nr:hypothetical protein [Longimicrobium sp.]